eukprot:137535-Prymnesium_polylepis.1
MENGFSPGSGVEKESNVTPMMRTNCICHGTDYDFNDNVLPRAIVMFCKIVEDRFGVKLFGEGERELKRLMSTVGDLSGVDEDVHCVKCA